MICLVPNFSCVELVTTSFFFQTNLSDLNVTLKLGQAQNKVTWTHQVWYRTPLSVWQNSVKRFWPCGWSHPNTVHHIYIPSFPNSSIHSVHVHVNTTDNCWASSRLFGPKWYACAQLLTQPMTLSRQHSRCSVTLRGIPAVSETGGAKVIWTSYVTGEGSTLCVYQASGTGEICLPPIWPVLVAEGVGDVWPDMVDIRPCSFTMGSAHRNQGKLIAGCLFSWRTEAKKTPAQ